MKNTDLVFKFLKDVNRKQRKNNEQIGCTTAYISKNLNISRANVSTILNNLHKNNSVNKSNTRPVIYYVDVEEQLSDHISIDTFFSNIDKSDIAISRAKAAMTYAPNGLDTCIIGEIGVGKAFFAKLMHNFACEEGVFVKDSPFYTVDCGKYQYNDKILIHYLFGLLNDTVDENALVFKIDSGVIFLKDPHLLLKETQELILFFINNKHLPNHTSEFDGLSNMLFICSCSGKKNNFAINQFSNNFPIIIELPALKNRSFADRLDYINIFFQIEADRLDKTIDTDLEVIECFLLYDCLENLVQLKRDIKNACEYALYHTTDKDVIKIDTNCIKSKVKQGLYNYKKHQNEIISILEDKDEFIYRVGDNKVMVEQFLAYSNSKHYNISPINYNSKRKMKIVNDYRDVELSKIFNDKDISIAKSIFNTASDKLDISYNKKSFFSLCMYLETSSNEKRQQESVYNSDSVKKQYYKEYQVVIAMKDTLREDYGFELTENNAVHISTFLNDRSDIFTYNNLVPPTIVLMHGVSVASSFVQTIKQLMYVENVHPYDIHLNKSSDTIYHELKSLIQKTNYTQGTLILSDIASLNDICNAIGDELNINIRIIDKIHMRLALESVFYLDHYRDLDFVYNKMSKSDEDLKATTKQSKENIIVIVGSKGDKSSYTTRDYIIDNVDCSTLNIKFHIIESDNENEIKQEIEDLKINNNILVIGEVNYHITNVEYLSLTDVYIYNSLVNIIKFAKRNAYQTSQHQNKLSIYQSVISNFKNMDVSYDVDIFNKLILHFLDELEIIYNITIPCDIGIGLITHVSATLSQLVNDSYESNFKINKEDTLDKVKFQQIRCLFYPLEKAFNVTFSEDEIYIIEYTLANYKPCASDNKLS